MKRILTAVALTATLMTGGIATAATVVYNPTAIGNPLPANKITTSNITVGDFVTSTEILAPGDTAEFRYTALTALRVNGIALSGTGNNGGTDIGNVEYGFSSATPFSFGLNGTVTPGVGNTAAATAFLPGLTLAAGDTFSIFWDDGISFPVGVTASFNVSAIPVPAALPLLLGALGLLGVARSRARA